METLFTSPFGQLNLKRLPHSRQGSLRAWDAADEYLLNKLAEHINGPTSSAITSPVLVLNDSFGAITLSIAPHCEIPPVMQTDSWLNAQGTRNNARDNGIEVNRYHLQTPIQPPTISQNISQKSPQNILQNSSLENSLTNSQHQRFGIVLIKIPKTLSMLEYQLRQIQPLVTPETIIIAGAMARNVHSSTVQMFERILGTSNTSLARKKARLIEIRCDAPPPAASKPTPKPTPGFTLETENLVLSNFANVFSLEQLDIGSRFFLPHIPSSELPRQIIDLGCGNGLLGLLAARRNPTASILFRDDSALAIACAEHNWQSNSGDTSRARFEQGDCLQGIEDNSADLILCNPPFHQQHTVGDQIAMRMFRQSLRALRKGGELRIIGNRHLGYYQSLRKIFGNAEQLDSNRKFVVLSARKTK